jgi:hypothetical protein
VLEGRPAAAPEFAKSPGAPLGDVYDAEEVEDDVVKSEGRADEGLAVNIAVEPVAIGAELDELDGFSCYLANQKRCEDAVRCTEMALWRG